MKLLKVEQVKAHTAACREVARFVNPDSFKRTPALGKRSINDIEKDYFSSIRRFWKFHTGHIYAMWNTRKLIITSAGELWMQDDRMETVTRVNAARTVLERVFDIHKEHGWYKQPSPIVAEIMPNTTCTALMIIPQQPSIPAIVPIPGMEIAAA